MYLWYVCISSSVKTTVLFCLQVMKLLKGEKLNRPNSYHSKKLNKRDE